MSFEIANLNGDGKSKVNISPSISQHAASKASTITPNDSNLIGPYRSLFVGGAGNIAVLTVEDDSKTFVGVQAGSILPVQVKKVLSTGTTATSILGLN